MIKYDVIYKTRTGNITHALLFIEQFERLMERSTQDGNSIIIYDFQVFTTQEKLEL